MKMKSFVICFLLCLSMFVIASCKDPTSNNNTCIKVSEGIKNSACNITDTASYVYNYASCAGYNVSVTIVPSMACNAISQTVINTQPIGEGGYTLKLDQERIAAWIAPNVGESITTIASRYGLTVESIKTTYNSGGVPVTINGAYITVAILDVPQGHTISDYLTSYGEKEPPCIFGNDPEIQFATPVFDYYGISGIQAGYVPITDQFQVRFTTTDFTPQPQFNQELNVGLAFSYSTGNTVTWLLQTTKQSPGNALDMVMLYTSSGFSCGETDWQTVHLQ